MKKNRESGEEEKEDYYINQSRRHLSCTTCFDALWFCYSPVHQMQQYYRVGVLDNCSGKWTSLVDCLTLKTKRSSELEDVIINHLECFETGLILVSGYDFSRVAQGLFNMVKNKKTSLTNKTLNHLQKLALGFLSDIHNLTYKEILETREKEKTHIWTFRTPEEAASNWRELFGDPDEVK